MNLYKFLCTICFISVNVFAFAQEKGYYSIGKNAEKLKIKGQHAKPDSFFRTEKGYYSMEVNRKKLKRSSENDTLYQRQFPMVNKGYFSIQNKAGKRDEQNE